MSSKKTLKSAIESMMFIWGEPLDIKDVADVFNVEKSGTKNTVDYAIKHGVEVRNIL